MKTLIRLIVICSLFLVSSSFAQDTSWTRTYGGSDIDNGYNAYQTADGGYAIGASTWSFGLGQSDYYLIRTDSSGDTLWTRTFGLSSHQDELKEMKPTSDGGFVLAGYAYAEAVDDWNVYLVRTDSNGDSLWTRTYAGEVNHDWQCDAVDETDDGGFILAGSIFTDHTALLLIRTDADGDTLWTRIFDFEHGGFRFNAAEAVEQTSDGGFIISGSTQYREWVLDALLIKTDANGDTLWSSIYDIGTYSGFHSVIQTDDGGYAAVSAMPNGMNAYDDALLVKFDADGSFLWSQIYGSDEMMEWGNYVKQTRDGGFILAGGSNNPLIWTECMYVVKTDPMGVLKWDNTYEIGDGSGGNSIVETSDGGFLACGYAAVNWNQEIWLVKIGVPAVAIDMIPDEPVIIIPAGSTFTYEGQLQNNTLDQQATDVWFKVKKPYSNHWLYPSRRYFGIPLEPLELKSFYPVTQYVPRWAYPGVYTYIAYNGTYPDEIMDSTCIYVTIYEFAGDNSTGASDWSSYGWGDYETFDQIPVEICLHGNYPNPFNAETNISFDVPVDAYVSLEVYNLMGQKVATLVDGNMSAGNHSVSWDACTASSGVYFYKLTAGEKVFTRRMTLLK